MPRAYGQSRCKARNRRQTDRKRGPAGLRHVHEKLLAISALFDKRSAITLLPFLSFSLTLTKARCLLGA
ncbi:hypothetical protein BJF92_02205 [Rhizobium rhizosphaerae]|uniref:Uncharacterized protein n=1 Tax=Xaviernesmea rhizosphaerae TaxID=1672749 RepID=A0A1Q9AL20_9HYPH|nr:hypothetical protein BJF92_02205 [Xaviernesmea rhizosphaerae]